MKITADLQLHSKYSRAVSKQMDIPFIARWASKKGIDLITTGDFTHPLWFREIRNSLEGVGEGIYQLKKELVDEETKNPPKFLLTTEISSIYSQGGKVRRIHTLIFAPNLETVEALARELTKRGANLIADGRPIVGLSAKSIAEIALSVNEKCLIIPAHAWTPHFAVFGQASGFDSLEECFGEFAPNIYAIETGLSSDPAMNWKIEELDKRNIVSFSDAHSGPKIGREATIFEIKGVLGFEKIREAIMNLSDSSLSQIVSTIEFYPEEGKYHYTGHRNCQVVYSPKEARKVGSICPVCKKPLTQGVASRVESLARNEIETESKTDNFGVRWIYNKGGKKPPYTMTVPLMEIIAEVLRVGVGSKRVTLLYDQMISYFGNEFKILLTEETEKIKNQFGEKVGEAISKVRGGNIYIEPGYDGVFGKVRIWGEEKDSLKQESFF
jgi:uncharacterized protein (TIGR00375 family)